MFIYCLSLFVSDPVIIDLINNLQQCKNYSSSVFQAEATEGPLIFIQPSKVDQFPFYKLYRDGGANYLRML